MKFQDMTREQQEAFSGLLLNIVSIKSQEEQQFTQQFFRLLILGNGMGIVLLATFMATMSGDSAQLLGLATPLLKFFVGAILAALVFFPLMAVSNQATIYIGGQVTKFFLNEIDIEEFRAYGLNKLERLAINVLLVGSLVAFSLGVYECIGVLRG